MYRVSKVLNNNGVIAIEMEENPEYVLLGKGIGFGFGLWILGPIFEAILAFSRKSKYIGFNRK